MPSKIRVLDEHTINQIAAGEVIENPASVVKELVENSIDAGSTEIHIEIKGGGRQLIRISDNGCGMNSDDAILCLERHATSKIKNVEDIFDVSTMGFRGEAIPSIASISKFTLITTPSDAKDNAGTIVMVEGGRILQCSPTIRSQGTTIEVKNLFFNVPVRKKFQRSPAYDANEILKVVSSLALSYPNITFHLINDSACTLSTPHIDSTSFQEQLGERIKLILGAEFFENCCYVEENNDQFKIRGFVGQPFYTRHNRTGQFLFLNQRAINSPLISFAIKDAYSTMLQTNRHPVYALHITISGSLVDVNVHPQKREVRLRQDQQLKEALKTAIQKALAPQAPSFEQALIMPKTEPAQPWYTPKQEPTEPVKEIKYDQLPLTYSKEEFPSHTIPVQEYKPFTTYRVLATLSGHFIFDPAPKEGMAIVDQQAAYSRIVYEQLAAHNQHTLVSQPLLIPFVFSTTPLETPLLLKELESLNDFAMHIQQIGPHQFSLDAIPAAFGDTDLHEFVKQLLDQIQTETNKKIFEQEKEKKIALAACRSATSYRKKLSTDMAQRLLNQLMRCQLPYQCPLGKPTIAYITNTELEKKFS